MNPQTNKRNRFFCHTGDQSSMPDISIQYVRIPQRIIFITLSMRENDYLHKMHLWRESERPLRMQMRQLGEFKRFINANWETYFRTYNERTRWQRTWRTADKQTGLMIHKCRRRLVAGRQAGLKSPAVGLLFPTNEARHLSRWRLSIIGPGL